MKYLIPALLSISMIVPTTTTAGDAPNVAEPEAATKDLPIEECQKLIRKEAVLTQAINTMDKKASELRKGIRDAVAEELVPLFTVTPSWAAIEQTMNGYANITQTYAELVQERDNAFDIREDVIDQLTAGCNYAPKSES